MEPTFFENTAAFTAWMKENHLVSTELVVGFYKKDSGKSSITWPESVDVALCFGWIDGVRNSIDADSYKIRFTPRKKSSIWSAVNVKKIAELTEQGLMYPAGIAAFEQIVAGKTKIYSYETHIPNLSPEFEAQFRANRLAWEYFEALANSYKRNTINYIMSAKQAATQQKRLNQMIADSAAGTNQWKDNKYMKK